MRHPFWTMLAGNLALGVLAAILVPGQPQSAITSICLGVLWTSLILELRRETL